MKTLEEKIEVMQAALAGAEIECKDNDEEECEWQYANNPCWGWDEVDYRIKPENKQVPFDFNDAESLIGRKVRDKEERSLFIITSVDKDSAVIIRGNCVNMKDLSKDYEIWNNTLNCWESCTKTVKA